MITMNHETGRSRGTAFVRYTTAEAAQRCLAAAAEGEQAAAAAAAAPAKEKDKKRPSYRSVLQDEQDESAGGLWLDGRRLAVTVAVDRSRAKELAEKGKEKRDKRNLYLAREGSTAVAGHGGRPSVRGKLTVVARTP